MIFIIFLILILNNSQPGSLWSGSESTVAPPAPNLSKWARPSQPKPTRNPQQPSAPLQKAHQQPTPSSSRLPPTFPTSKWPTPPTSSRPGPLGKWALPPSQPTERTNPLSSPRADASVQRTSPTASPIGRWARQDLPPHQRPQDPSSFGINRNARLQRDEAPHKVLNIPSGDDARRDDRRDRLRGGLTRDTKLRSWGNSNTIPKRNEDRLKSTEPPQDKDLVNADVQDDTTVLVENYINEDSIPTEEPVPDRVAGLGRDRANFKTRGSITSQIRSGDAVFIRGQQRTIDLKAKLNAGKDKKRKAKALKKVNADVFIPSTVSVGQLARLLNVRMGACKY